jgi:hypothetical protein
MADNIGSGSTPVVSENESSNHENSNTNSKSTKNICKMSVYIFREPAKYINKYYEIKYGKSEFIGQFIEKNNTNLLFKDKKGGMLSIPFNFKGMTIKPLGNNTGGKRKTKKIHRKRKARITKKK